MGSCFVSTSLCAILRKLPGKAWDASCKTDPMQKLEQEVVKVSNSRYMDGEVTIEFGFQGSRSQDYWGFGKTEVWSEAKPFCLFLIITLLWGILNCQGINGIDPGFSVSGQKFHAFTIQSSPRSLICMHPTAIHLHLTSLSVLHPGNTYLQACPYAILGAQNSPVNTTDSLPLLPLPQICLILVHSCSVR